MESEEKVQCFELKTFELSGVKGSNSNNNKNAPNYNDNDKKKEIIEKITKTLN